MFFEGDAEEALWCVVLTLDFSLRVGRLSEGRKALGLRLEGFRFVYTHTFSASASPECEREVSV